MESGCHDSIILDLLKPFHQNLDQRFDGSGQTIMMFAAKLGNTNLVEKLLERGANANVQDYQGNTALHWAFKFEFRQTQNLLINYGANQLIPNDQGLTPW